MGRKPKQKQPDFARLVAIQGEFERAKLDFEAREPAARREAKRRGATLVITTEQTQVGDCGLLLVSEQSLSYSFERAPTVPKSKRAQCGAKTRAGGACRATVCLKPNGRPAKRCRLHGGKSTGPASQAGRDAISASNRRRRKQPLQNELTPEQIAMLDEVEAQIAARGFVL